MSNNVAKNGDIVAKHGNSVEATFEFVERIVRLIAFNNVALTLLLVWTGLKAAQQFDSRVDSENTRKVVH